MFATIKRKSRLFFSAMRHFAQSLEEKGFSVDYQYYDNQNAVSTFTLLLTRAVKKHKPTKILVVEAGEHRLKREMESWIDLGAPVEILEDDRFLASHEEFQQWAAGRKTFRMEYFYREMRQRTGLLMEDGKPIGGQWNFDHDNRKVLADGVALPAVLRTKPDDITDSVLRLVKNTFADHFGELHPFELGVTRKHALRALNHFIKHALPLFGDYQDAMVKGERFLFHSLLSLYLNIGLLSPMEICRRVEKAYLDGEAPLNAAEGYIRQIIGWREFIRGVYWHEGDDYTSRNFLNATRDLPSFYWTGDTDMTCMREAISQTKEEAYAHHIQRLMVTGNFALLAGVDPRQVHEWYLAVYFDAYEWVEAPNTIGMSQFADGGVVGSKPYAASGNYINKMSDYCKGCAYSVKEKTGPKSCPFNALYWDFLIRNEKVLRSNPRMGQIYRNWDRLSDDKKAAYLETAAATLNKI